MVNHVIRAAEAALHPLIFPAFVFPIIAAVIFVLLGFVIHSFRDVANRHSDRTGGSTASGHTTDH